MYDIATKTFPAIDDSSSNVSSEDLLPVIIIRNNLVNTKDTNKNGSLYKDTTKVLKVLGLSLDDITAEINKNPDIGTIDDSFVHFAISPNDTDPIVSRMLFEMFYAIYADNNLVNGSEGYSATYESGPMKKGLGWVSQSLISTNGTIGKVGTYSHSISGKNLVMKYQNNVFSYSTLTIVNLNSIDFITRGALSGTTDHSITDDSFCIPISYSLVQKFSNIEQTAILAKSLRITFYALVVQHIKWYQQGIFGTFLKIIGVIVMILGCIYSGCTASSVGYAIVMAAAVGLALKLIMKYVHVPWLRAVLSIVVVIVAAYAGGAFDTGMLSANGLTTIVTAFGTGVSIYAGAALENINKDRSAFNSLIEKRQSEIDNASKNYNKGLVLSDIAELQSYDPVQEYITSTVDYMIYMSRDIQFQFDMLYNYDIMTTDYHDNKLRIALK